VLTFKEPAVDESGSKPEYETELTEPAAIAHMVEALGYGPSVQLTKECANHRFERAGRTFLATVVRVPELDGTFLEVETMAEEDDLAAALAAVREVLAELGVSGAELTAELYTDAVRAARE
jgi:adenylate cyclase class 2